MAETIPSVFLVLMKDITKPGLATSEGAEHTFGMLRTIVREFTTMQFVQLVEKTTRRLNLMFLNGFSTSRDPQKGYASTFKDFIEHCHDERPSMMDGSVEVDPNGSPVVEELWSAVGKVIAYASSLIEPLLATVGVTPKERSPFCRKFSSPTDLRDEFIAYLPRTFSFDDATGTADAGNTDEEAGDAPAASPEAIVLG